MLNHPVVPKQYSCVITREMYAVRLQSMGQVRRFLRRNPSVCDALLVMFVMCMVQFRSSEIRTAR
jgi:hypothetical protein